MRDTRRVRETILFAIDRCMTETANLNSSPPRPDVISLYRALYGHDFRSVMISTRPRDETVAWLKREHIGQWVMLLAREATEVLEPSAWKVDQITNLVAEGWKLSFYVDNADLESTVLSSVRRLGVPTLTVGYPSMTDNSVFVRDQRHLRSWEEVLDSVEQRNQGE